MNSELVKSMFLQMTGKKEATPYRMYLQAAEEETMRLLRPEYAQAPPYLVCAYAAAVAVRMWVMTRSAQERTVCTEAGTLPASEDTAPQRDAVEALVSGYRALCSTYLRDDAFTMMGILPKRNEVKPHAESHSSGDEIQTTEGLSL